MKPRNTERGRTRPGQPTLRTRRRRKARRTGEFTEWGFDVRATLVDATTATFGAVIDGLVPVVEARGIGVGGGGCDERVRLFATRLGRGSATDADRAAVRAHLAADPRVVAVDVGPLVDAVWGDAVAYEDDPDGGADDQERGR
jgi:uncharacterized protein YggL (DUF469 family)